MVRPPQTTSLTFCISFSSGWFWSLSAIQCYEPPSIDLQALCLSDLISWIYLSICIIIRDLAHLKGLVLFPTFFNLRMNFAIWSSSSEPQAAPSLVFADCIELPHFHLQEYNHFDFGVDYLVMSMCRIISCVVGRGRLLWPVCPLGKGLIAVALLHFVLQDKTCLLLQVSHDFLLLHSSPLWWKGHLFLVLVLYDLVGLHRMFQLQRLRHWCLGHRLGLLWCWMVHTGSKLISFCCFWDCIQVLHFRPFVDYDGYSISSKEFLPT